MNPRPTTVVQVVMGKIGAVANRLLKRPVTDRPVHGYRLVRDLTTVYSQVGGRVGLYKDDHGTDFIIKQCRYDMEDLNAVYMHNEGYILKTIGQAGQAAGIAPQFKALMKHPHHTVLVTGVAQGKKLDSFGNDVQGRMIVSVYERLKQLSLAVSEKQLKLPVRNPLFYFVSTLVNVAKLIVTDPRNAGSYVGMALSFYAQYTLGCLGGVSLGLVHRDLYPDNILYDPTSESLTVLDWESAVVSDNLYDLAQIAMIYTKTTGTKFMIRFLKEQLETNQERRRFIGLSLFNSLQILSNNRPGDVVFTETRTFIDTLVREIAPAIIYKKTPYEIVYGLSLDCISMFYAITRLPMNDPRRKIILCYHSVGNDGWRFSTRPRTFEEHVALLAKSYRVTSLPELLSSSNGGVTISFDDGYQSVLDTALPTLAKVGIPATLFVLGDPAHANRAELDNALPIMQDDGVRTLQQAGWEIGYHTATHPNLGRLSQKELDQELGQGRERCQRKLGMELRYFAYPKGIYSDAVVETVRKAGFEAAFTVDGTVADPRKTGDFLIDRVPIDGELTARQLKALLSPLGLRMAWLYMQLLVLKERYITSRFRYATT